jgi:hypothetical protein
VQHHIIGHECRMMCHQSMPMCMAVSTCFLRVQMTFTCRCPQSDADGGILCGPVSLREPELQVSSTKLGAPIR